MILPTRMWGVISLVPSWTETLVWAKVPVLGRTRYCIHPKPRVQDIPIIGGTKSVQSWPHLNTCRFVLLDREENVYQMAQESPYPTLITHVLSLSDLHRDLRNLATTLESPELMKLAQECHNLCEVTHPCSDITQLPGVIHWIRLPKKPIHTILYLIWKDPWMAVSRHTFIGDVLAHVGFELPLFQKKYPCVELDRYDPHHTLLLCSSEPYPFHKKQTDLKSLPFPTAVVAGDLFSWFGLRSIRFLSAIQRKK